MRGTLRIVPVTIRTATDFIAEWHRHNRPPQGCRFVLGVAQADTLVGVATAGRPISPTLDDGLTIEVTRVCTDGTPNACSALYGACWRTAKAMGYQRAVTYTQSTESGSSLRAAGWIIAAQLRPRTGWNMPGRCRVDRHETEIDRLRWQITTGCVTTLPTTTSRRDAPHDTEVTQLNLFVGSGGGAA